MIPDVDYEPSRIHPGKQPGSGAPLDLGKALLRSVSPIHLEYLRNMDVKAGLAVSLVDDGRLWGLIACHHAAPLLADSDARAAAELIGRLVSSQLRAKEELDDRHYNLQLDQAHACLISALESELPADSAGDRAPLLHRLWWRSKGKNGLRRYSF